MDVFLFFASGTCNATRGPLKETFRGVSFATKKDVAILLVC